ncbi:MAG TPA: group-specific protein [Bacillus bacterium]|nr:group-specific protein [Bacillus sp. (in: firmicutes)]
MACDINHTKEDVLKKLESQKEFLPAELYPKLESFIQTNLPQETLNEIFHLLKKYDLAGEAEQRERNEVLKTMVAE